jgi:threonine dehydrogenase-like Zn-dependent dehydrogenase
VRIHEGGVVVVDVPEPKGGGVLVRVASAGICGTDIHMLNGGLTATLGHEFAGWLDDGTPVAVEPLAPCGVCPSCTRGDYQLCPDCLATAYGFGRDGGMAELCLVPQRSIVRLPVGLEPRNACLVEPLAVAVHGIRRGAITGTDRVAVVGGGSIGLCAVAAARATGVHVDLAARHDHQLVAGERLGAGPMVGEGYDIVVDAVGSTASLGQCVTIARPGGRIVLLGANWDGLNIPDSEFILKELCIVPSVGYSRSGPSRDVDVAARILAAMPEVADALITHRYPLDDAVEAFAVASDRASSGAIKVVLQP